MIVPLLQQAVAVQLKSLYQFSLETPVPVTETKPDFEGDYTVVLFTLLKPLRKAPDQLGTELGQNLLQANPELFSSFNVIKGFLNLTISDAYWTKFLHTQFANERYGSKEETHRRIMVEYSSPNTNKPLHLGHLRNNFLGWSMAEIFKANGARVIKSCIVNDRGIHICKSMLAWQKFGNGATPESTNTKGDHLVGDYYVAFEKELKKQADQVLNEMAEGRFSFEQDPDRQLSSKLVDKLSSKEVADDKKKEIQAELMELARANTPIMHEAREMLRRWEEGDPETIELWRKMNDWVYRGFDETYRIIGSDFDHVYYESDTYLLGKELVEEGLKKGVFQKKEDGSVWIDLTSDGLDEKLLLRKDGTSVYITQDIGLAKLKQEQYHPHESIYVVGDEQNYHLKVLKLICQKLDLDNADGIHHLSYGMVELPSGRMKSREGTVVDADDIVDEMKRLSEQHTLALGKVADFSDDELNNLYEVLGLGALKFFLLRVDPKKRMIFNPEESIDFHGFTGPFIQYSYARTRSILRKESPAGTHKVTKLLPHEKNVIVTLERFPLIVDQAAQELNPSVIAGYAFRLAQVFNSFVTELRVLNAETADKKEFRLQLCQMTVNVIRSAMGLLGIKVPEKM